MIVGDGLFELEQANEEVKTGNQINHRNSGYLELDSRKVSVTDVEGKPGGEEVALEGGETVLGEHLGDVVQVLIRLEVLTTTRKRE